MHFTQYGAVTEYKASVSMTTDHSLETKFLLCWNIPVTVSSNDLQWNGGGDGGGDGDMLASFLRSLLASFSGLPHFFILLFAFSIIHGSKRAAKKKQGRPASCE